MTKTKKPAGEHAQTPTTNATHTRASKPTSNISKPTFQGEIMSMMVALGDGPKPLPRTAGVIEEIVHSQMALLLVQAAEMTALRSARVLTIEDIFFLLRHNKEKIWRVTSFLCNKEAKLKAGDGGEDQLDLIEEYNKAMGLPVAKKKCFTLDFLNTADNPTGDIERWIFGGQRQGHIKSAGEATGHEECRYLDILDAHSISFGKRPVKFREWLECSSVLDIKPNTLAMEALAALATDSLIELVNLAMAVRQEQFDQEHYGGFSGRSSHSVATSSACFHPSSLAPGKLESAAASTPVVESSAVLRSALNSTPALGSSILLAQAGSQHVASELSSAKVSVTKATLSSVMTSGSAVMSMSTATSASSSNLAAMGLSGTTASVAGQFAASRTAVVKAKKKVKPKASLPTIPPIPPHAFGTLTPADVREALRRLDRPSGLRVPFMTVSHAARNCYGVT